MIIVNVNIYDDYEMYLISKSAIIDNEKTEGSHKEYKVIEEKREITLEGKKLLETIKYKMNDKDLVSFAFSDKVLIFEYYDKTTGENGRECLIIKEKMQ